MLYYSGETRSGLFFCAVKSLANKVQSRIREVKKCVPGSHLPAQSARTETTIQRRIRRHIPTVWKQRSTADFAKSIHYIRRLSNGREE